MRLHRREQMPRAKYGHHLPSCNYMNTRWKPHVNVNEACRCIVLNVLCRLPSLGPRSDVAVDSTGWSRSKDPHCVHTFPPKICPTGEYSSEQGVDITVVEPVFGDNPQQSSHVEHSLAKAQHGVQTSLLRIKKQLALLNSNDLRPCCDVHPRFILTEQFDAV